jgi:hypothetical protein
VERIIIKELENPSKDHQQTFFALHNAYGSSHSPSLPIARTNVLPLGSGAPEGGLFLQESRINHSCIHNAQNTWNANIERLTIHHLHDIEGQGITIAYLSGSPDYAERQRDLKEKVCLRLKMRALPDGTPWRRRSKPTNPTAGQAGASLLATEQDHAL